MKKTVKRKVIAGTVVVGLLSSTGVAFGATDAGAGIKNWYDAKFRKASTEVALETAQHSAQKFIEFNDGKNQLKRDATDDINKTRDTATGTATDGIKAEKDKYIASVQSTKTDIENKIDSQFNKIEKDANRALNGASFIAKNLAEADLKNQTDKDGKAALAHVNTEIEETTNAAISELETEIRSTKSYLQGLLNNKSGATVEKINKAVDDEITRILGLITTKTEQLVASHQTAISNKAAELEVASKLKLENRVKELLNEK
ncbi:hypothetical protein [Psychrobacillus sp. NPDC096389]|uniref:hypothetical protein n=1 Tax=Psychrobacillus sp. NPDC096389 TaxID=3364490 RepID=UPI0038262027